MDKRIDRPTWAEIHINHLKKNSKLLQSSLQEDAFYCPMVKANAYGHGATEVVKALTEVGVKNFGVGLVEEGIELRQAGINENLLVFGGYSEQGAKDLLNYNLTPVLIDWHQLELLKKVAGNKVLDIHLHFNTGMNRLGWPYLEAQAVAKYLKEETKWNLVGVGTHFLSGEDGHVKKGYTGAQLENFKKVANVFSNPAVQFHAANSAAFMTLRHRFDGFKTWPEKWKLGLRPGLSLYGAAPDIDSSMILEIEPVLSLKSQLITIQKVKKGEVISYGPSWIAQRDSLIGILPIGYADGYRRALSNKADVLIRGQRVPVVGTVCMGFTLIDLTDLSLSEPDLREQEITLIGKQLSQRVKIEDLAKKSDTIPYEIMTGISSRVPRFYIKG